MQKQCKYTFGDIIHNHWAGEGNPHKYGVFVRRISKAILLTDMRGDFWQLADDSESKSEVVGNILDGTKVDFYKELFK